MISLSFIVFSFRPHSVAAGGLSLVVEGRGHPPVAVYGLLTVAASHVGKHGLHGAWASVVATDGLQSTGPVVVVHRHRCPVALGSSWTRG